MYLDMATVEYTSIKVPRTLAERINKVAPVLGYRSVSEFILDSARRHLDKIEEVRSKST